MTPVRAAIFFFCLISLFPAFSYSAETEKGEFSKEMIFRRDSGLVKAEYLLSAGQFSAALDTVKDVLQRHPGDADAYTYRGYAYYRLGETASAVKDFKKALELDPSHLGANKYLADTYLDEGKVSLALEQLQAVRMICGNTDCEELRSLRRGIDSRKHGIRPEKEQSDKKEE